MENLTAALQKGHSNAVPLGDAKSMQQFVVFSAVPLGISLKALMLNS